MSHSPTTVTGDIRFTLELYSTAQMIIMTCSYTSIELTEYLSPMNRCVILVNVPQNELTLKRLTASHALLRSPELQFNSAEWPSLRNNVFSMQSLYAIGALLYSTLFSRWVLETDETISTLSHALTSMYAINWFGNNVSPLIGRWCYKTCSFWVQERGAPFFRRCACVSSSSLKLLSIYHG